MPKPPLPWTQRAEQRRFVVGIDPSLSGTAVVILDSTGALVDKQSFSCDPIDPPCVASRVMRYESIMFDAAAFLKEVAPNPVVACIEHYSMGSNQAQHSAIIEHGFVMRKMLVERTNADLYEVFPTTLKKFCTGRGVGDKVAIASALTHRYGVRFADDNEADAYGLARLALQIAAFELPANDQQREVIATVTNGAAKKPKKSRKR